MIKDNSLVTMIFICYNDLRYYHKHSEINWGYLIKYIYILKLFYIIHFSIFAYIDNTITIGTPEMQAYHKA